MTDHQANGRNTLFFAVEGMQCGGCVKAVETVLKRLDPQAEIMVDLDAATASVTGARDAAEIAAALTKAGFPASRTG
jgi:copper chaperone